MARERAQTLEFRVAALSDQATRRAKPALDFSAYTTERTNLQVANRRLKGQVEELEDQVQRLKAELEKWQNVAG
jgi:chaperonin cofactor prefoldin